MKKTALTLLAIVGLASASFAGHAVVTRDYKADKTPPPPTCFNDVELQLDLFGAVGFGGEADGLMGDDTGWGGGIGVNYFFLRNVGVGLDATILGSDDTAFIYTANLIFRLPIDSACIAPYLFAGGGYAHDGDSFGVVDVGGGLEYRAVPHRVGIFSDVRWSYLFDDGQNFWTARAGVRFVF